MAEPRIYAENGIRLPHGGILSEKAYCEVVRNLVIVCADVVPVDSASGVIYLARRVIKPMQGWWVIGGTLRRGETGSGAAVRNFDRETRVDLAPERLTFLGIHRYWWKDRQQEPQNDGSDNLAYTFAVALTPEELAHAASHLDPHEYDTDAGLQPFTREKLLRNGVHPAIVDLYDLIFPPLLDPYLRM